jgi:adenylate cyclase
MAIEIERKFLVRGEDWRLFVTMCTDIRLAYLSSGGHASTRVRINDSKAATLTVKSKRAELRRAEVECAISVADAEALLITPRIFADQQGSPQRAVGQSYLGGG